MELIKFWFYSIISFFNSNYEGEAFVAEMKARLDYTELFRFWEQVGFADLIVVAAGLFVVLAVANVIDYQMKKELA